MKDIQVAEDLVQDTFEVAINKIDTFQGKGSFNGWIKRIAINHCLQYLRDQQSIRMRKNEFEKNWQQEMKVDENNDSRQTVLSRKELLEVIDDLPEQHKLVFNMYVLDGYKHHEIADLLNISVGTSKSNLSRARKKAKEALSQKIESKEIAVRHSWIILFFLRFNCIDLVFKKGLMAYSIATASAPILVSIASNTNLPVVFSLTAKVALVMVAMGTIMGVVYIINGEEDEDVVETTVIQHIEDSPVAVDNETDTLTIATQEDLNLVIEQEVDVETEVDVEAQKSKPIVIHKKRIVRDTVYVRK